MTTRPSVLVIDDDTEMLQLIAALLGRYEMNVITANNAKKGARVLRDAPPDLLILDMMLPDISGVDLLKNIRRKPQLQAMPICVLSALADPIQIREALDSGADRYLTKAYLANNLVSTVKDLLAKGRPVNRQQ